MTVIGNTVTGKIYIYMENAVLYLISKLLIL